MPHFIIDAEKAFAREVKEYFVRSYEAGETPNPCVMCNKQIKFGLLADFAKSMGYDGIATGHYAKLVKENGRAYLYRAADVKKDQSYFLSVLSQDQLSFAEFPLGDFTKTEIRSIAEQMDFITAKKKDSQDICFIADNDYVRFISEYTGESPTPGDYTDLDGKLLGQHRGHLCYTVGQRKGLGISLGKHAYVVSKNPENNTVVLGDEADLYTNNLNGKDLNLIACDSLIDGEEFTVKIRYSHPGAEAKVYNDGDGRVRIIFSSMQRAITKGQLAVFYSGDCVVGSCVIE